MIITDYMTIEEIMNLFYEEYGEEFNWHMIPFTNKTYVNELKKELGKNDNLVDQNIYSVAKCDSNDDVLFLVGDLWRIYHLTYSTNNMPGYPKYEEFSSRREAAEYIRDQYVNDYL